MPCDFTYMWSLEKLDKQTKQNRNTHGRREQADGSRDGEGVGVGLGGRVRRWREIKARASADKINKPRGADVQDRGCSQ